MLKSWIFVIGAALVFVSPGAALAAGRGAGWYANVSAAYVIVDDSDLEDPALGSLTGQLSADDGFGLSGALGYRYGMGLRTEGELLYRDNDLDRIRVGGFGATVNGQLKGDVTAIAGMINGFYDFDFHSTWTPYLGGGIGIADISIDIDNPSVISTDDSDTVFAYQVIAGVDVAINERASVGLRYRLFGTEDPQIGNTEGEYLTHSFEIGITLDL